LFSRACRTWLPFGLTQGQISQIWPVLIALGLEIFRLAFWLFFGLLGEFGIEDFCLALMLFFANFLAFWGLFGPFLYEATIEVTECAPTPIFRYLYKAVKLLSNMKFIVVH